MGIYAIRNTRADTEKLVPLGPFHAEKQDQRLRIAQYFIGWFNIKFGSTLNQGAVRLPHAVRSVVKKHAPRSQETGHAAVLECVLGK